MSGWPEIGWSESGFTLVELLGVTVIVIILSLIGLQVFDDAADRARWARSREDQRIIEMGLERYRVDHSTYPDRLGDLVSEGYVKATSFETPWSSSKRRLYYFYAVDNPENGRSMAYGLGDPGPTVTCPVLSGQHPPLVANSAIHLPCGRSANVRAWSFSVDADLDVVDALEVSRGHVTLRSYRTACRSVQGLPLARNSGCDLKTES